MNPENFLQSIMNLGGPSYCLDEDAIVSIYFQINVNKVACFPKMSRNNSLTVLMLR